jgi:hypothetical protein
VLCCAAAAAAAVLLLLLLLLLPRGWHRHLDRYPYYTYITPHQRYHLSPTLHHHPLKIFHHFQNSAS